VSPRRRALGTALALLCLPLAVALAEIGTFKARNRNNRSLISGGVEREYLLYVPASYEPGRPTPLVISMHGAGGWPVQQSDISGWNAVADEHGFIVAYPSGRGGGASRAWSFTGARDARFVSDLIDDLEREYDIDHARIYANGLSAGGGMSFLLSCRLWERIAAIGSVAGAYVASWDECAEPRPLPVIAFHGTADAATPYAGGASWVGDIAFPDVERWTARWAERNGCAPAPVDAAVAADVRRRAYHGCAGAADVVLFTVLGGGHTWPGGLPLPEWLLGPTSRSIDATREMWAFFAKHAKAEAPQPAPPTAGRSRARRRPGRHHRVASRSQRSPAATWAANVAWSMLAPQMTRPTRRPRSRSRSGPMSAAVAAAPAGSTASLAEAKSRYIARRSWSSLTRTRSST